MDYFMKKESKPNLDLLGQTDPDITELTDSNIVMKSVTVEP